MLIELGKNIASFQNTLLLLSSMLWIVSGTEASKVASVIDDIGYRPVNENKILQLSLPISIVILPHAPYARARAIKAHNQGREILIHLPMALLSKQPLEHDTLDLLLNKKERFLGMFLGRFYYYLIA